MLLNNSRCCPNTTHQDKHLHQATEVLQLPILSNLWLLVRLLLLKELRLLLQMLLLQEQEPAEQREGAAG
jgi:hypothetical protein